MLTHCHTLRLLRVRTVAHLYGRQTVLDISALAGYIRSPDLGYRGNNGHKTMDLDSFQ